jgi:ribosomal protein S18 acetylase RimI-like enzyme
MVDSDLAAAAELLAGRQRRQRLRTPELTRALEDVTECRTYLESMFATAASTTMVEDDGRLVGYALAEERDETVWGPCVWFTSGRLAVASPSYIGELYAGAVQGWVDQGKTHHYVMVPADFDDELWRWFELSFGIQHTLGIRDTTLRPTTPSDVTVRLATLADAPAVADLDPLVPQHQLLAPVFSAMQPSDRAVVLAESIESIEQDEYTVLVAERDGGVVGMALLCSPDMSSLYKGPAAVPGAGYLAYAVVRDDARGGGVGSALTRRLVALAADQGFENIVVDYRSTNLLSSRAWRGLGFRPIFHRLHRVVGH